MFASQAEEKHQYAIRGGTDLSNYQSQRLDIRHYYVKDAYKE